MPRSNWKTAPNTIRQNLEGWRANIPTLESALSWVTRVFSAGYDLDESEVPQKCTTELAAAPQSQRSMYQLEHGTELHHELAALNLWHARRTWAQGSNEDDAAKCAQQREAANAERARVTQARFVNGLAATVQGLVADQWRRANSAWQQEHQNRLDPTDEPAQPTFNDVVDMVLARLGYVRATEQATRTRKAS